MFIRSQYFRAGNFFKRPSNPSSACDLLSQGDYFPEKSSTYYFVKFFINYECL